MKRNSLFTKLFAMLLCVVMAVSCLSLSAFAANDWEGDIDVVAPTGPEVDANLTFVSFGLSFQEYIGINSLIYSSAAAGYDRVYVEAVQATPDGNVTEILEGVLYYYDMFYVFDKQVLSWSMTEEVTLTLYAEKGDVLYKGESRTGSVAQLALAALPSYVSANDTTSCRVLVDMLNYGAAVQNGFNYNTSNVPNAGEYATYGTSATPTIDAENTVSGTGTVSSLGESLSMQSKVEVQMMFNAAQAEGYDLRVTVDGETTVIDIMPLEGYEQYYSVARIAFKASNLRKVHTIAVYNSETNEVVSPIYSVSVEAYAEKALSQYEAVIIAMMKYGDSVAAIG